MKEIGGGSWEVGWGKYVDQEKLKILPYNTKNELQDRSHGKVGPLSFDSQKNLLECLKSENKGKLMLA